MNYGRCHACGRDSSPRLRGGCRGNSPESSIFFSPFFLCFSLLSSSPSSELESVRELVEVGLGLQYWVLTFSHYMHKFRANIGLLTLVGCWGGLVHAPWEERRTAAWWDPALEDAGAWSGSPAMKRALVCVEEVHTPFWLAILFGNDTNA